MEGLVAMPPIKPSQPQKPSGFFASCSALLLKFRALLDLLISDLLRLIFVFLLFVLVVIATIGVLSYQQWYPKLLSTFGFLTTTSSFPAQ